MARFLLSNVDANPTDPASWKEGDVVWVIDDGQEFGDHEDYDKWLASGRRAEDWPGRLIIVDVPGMPLAEALTYKEQVVQ